MRKVIGVDLDDVLADFHTAFIKFCNEVYGGQFSKEKFVHPEFAINWNLSCEEIMRRVDAFNAAGSENKIDPMPGSQAKIRKLAQTNRLHIITNRPVEMEESTMRWVERHFPGQFQDIHFCTKDWTRTILYRKNVACRKIGAMTLLEDHLHNVHHCAEDGIHVYLYDQPWNRQDLPLLAGSIQRVLSWNDSILNTL